MNTHPQVRIPTDAFGRWLLRSRIALPVPLGSTCAATVPLDLDEVVELTSDRIHGGRTAAELEGIEGHAARTLESVRDLLADPALVAFACRTDASTTTSVAGLILGRRAVLLVDGPDEVVLRPLPATDVAEAVARALPALRAADVPVIDIPTTALAVLAEQDSPAAPAAVRAARAAGIDEATLCSLWRLHADTRARGIVLASAPGKGSRVIGAGDWFETGRGALLKHDGRPGHLCFEPATRAVLTRTVATALAAAAA